MFNMLHDTLPACGRSGCLAVIRMTELRLLGQSFKIGCYPFLGNFPKEVEKFTGRIVQCNIHCIAVFSGSKTKQAKYM
jgi:hypothetical protein